VDPDESAAPGAERSFEDRSFQERYRDLSEVGRGGYSVVYRAFSPEFNREVAVKIFEGHLAEADIRRRFRRECQVIGTLGDHPHVVSVFDSGFTTDGQPYLVMAYCSGGSFWQRIAGQGPRPPAEAAVVGMALADALDAAHSRGIVHRDVKPQNVLLTGYGVVALADFGVATAPTGDLRSFAATPGYVAPEVVLGGSAGGPTADVYSVGATLYALLTGGPPVRPDIGEPEAAYLFRCAEEPVPPLPAGVPPALARVILECLEKDPTARPSGAASLRRRLRLAAVEDGLELPERLEPLPVPASLAPVASVAVDRNATTEPTARSRWPRIIVAACLAGGLVAGGIAGNAILNPGTVEAGAFPFGADGGTPPDGQEQPGGDDGTGTDGTGTDGTGPDGTGTDGVASGGESAQPVSSSGSPAGRPGDGGLPPVGSPEGPGGPTTAPTSAPTSDPTSAPTTSTTTTSPAATVTEEADKEKKPKKPKKPKKNQPTATATPVDAG
jgi:serine/threonine protein kinase